MNLEDETKMVTSLVVSPLGANKGRRATTYREVKERMQRAKGNLLVDELESGADEKENAGAVRRRTPTKLTAKCETRNLEGDDAAKIQSHPIAQEFADGAFVENVEIARGGASSDQVLRLHDLTSAAPYLDFGAVHTGGSKTVLLEVLNDSSEAHKLQLDQMPTERGFSLTEVSCGVGHPAAGDDDEDDDYDGTYRVAPGGRIQIGLRWCPDQEGSAREIVHFKVKGEGRTVRCIVFGECIARGGKEAAASGAPQGRKRFLGGGGRRLAFSAAADNPKKAKTERPAPRSARPGFAAFHTNLWMQKRERAFAAWLNRALLADGHRGCRASAWKNCRLGSRVSAKLWNLYSKDDDLKRAVLKVEALVDSGKLALKERGSSLFTDLRLQKEAVSAIMSYGQFWLAHGLEAVLGGGLPAGAADMSAEELRRSVVDLLVEDRDAAERLSTAGTANGSRKPEYAKARPRAFLKKFLLLVKLLDRAMAEEDAYEVPLLFRRKGKVKSSAEMVQAVLGSSLHGEGNVLRHLKFHGYAVSYEQAPVLEYDFKVDNLAVDLRDGVRLSKLVDYMSNRREGLVAGAKVSSRARAARMANTERVFAEVKRLGVSLNGVLSRFGLLDLKPKDIVEGDQELTLQFLWRVMRDWQIPNLVKASRLEVEIDRVRGEAELDASVFEADESMAAHAGEPVIGLLLRWAQTICAKRGVPVKNFTSSFADGYALCVIANHYAPDLVDLAKATRVDGSDEERARAVPRSEAEIGQVKANFTMMHECMSQIGGLPRMLSSSDFDSYGPDEIAVISFLSFVASSLMQLSREDRSATIIQRKWRKSRVPPERPIDTLRSWISSASVIQREWRAHLERKFSSAEWLMKVEAATKIQRAYRDATLVREAKCLVSHKLECITTIQAQWRMRNERRDYNALRRSVQTIQVSFRAWSARRYFRESFIIPRILSSGLERKIEIEQTRLAERQKHSATIIQKNFRAMLVRRESGRQKAAVVTIQKHLRQQRLLSQMKQLHMSATQIQSVYRSYVIRTQYKHAHSAATKIQASYKMHVQVAQFKKDMCGIVKAQSMVRTWLVQKSMAQQRDAAVKIQSMFKSHAAKKLLVRHKAAVCVQKAYRSYVIRTQYKHAHSAATKIQASYKMHVQVAQFKKDMCGIVKAQSMVRTWLVQKSMAQQRDAAVKIQSMFRGYSARSAQATKLEKIVEIQKHFRAFMCRKRYKRYMKMKKAMEDFARAARLFTIKSAAATKIQSNFRTFVCRRSFRSHVLGVKAAVRIQSLWRSHRQRREYEAVLGARAVLRKFVPLLVDRTRFLRMRSSARLIQSKFRDYLARRDAKAVVIQSYARGFLAKVEARHRNASIVKIQSFVRSHRVQAASGQDLKAVRSRLVAATARVRANPKLGIGHQTQAALAGLSKAKSIQSAISLCKVLEFSTASSTRCCSMVCGDVAAVSSLLRFARACNRSEPHVDYLRRVLATLLNIVDADSNLASGLAGVEEIFTTIGELLQMYRGKSEIFLPAARVLHALAAVIPRSSVSAGEIAGLRRKLEGISQILKQKLRLEKKYIHHMETRKGSDVLARESATKVVKTTRELQSVYDVLNCLEGEAKYHMEGQDCCAAKNTIVRRAFMETQNLRGLGRE